MENYSQPGEVLEFTAPSGGVTTGVPKQIGNVLVVPTVTAAINIRFNALIRGVVRYTKAPSQAWTEGARVFWDAGNGRFTTVGAGNLLVGFAVEANTSGATDTIGTVYLNAIASDTGT